MKYSSVLNVKFCRIMSSAAMYHFCNELLGNL